MAAKLSCDVHQGCTSYPHHEERDDQDDIDAAKNYCEWAEQQGHVRYNEVATAVIGKSTYTVRRK